MPYFWKKNFFWLLTIAVFIFLVLINDYEIENRKTLIFKLEDNNSSLNGEVFLDNLLIGTTNGGKIKLPYLNDSPKNIKFSGIYSSKHFELIYDFPNNKDYDLYDIFLFSASLKNIEDYNHFYILKKEDNFSEQEELHWRHMPLLYRINKPEKCRPFELKRINASLELIYNSTNHFVSFLEITGDEADIIFNCDLPKDFECGTAVYTKSYKPKWDFPELINKTLISSTNKTNEWLLCYRTFQTLGDALPLTLDNLILNTTINLYYENGSSDCLDFPSIILHELLHSFGFDHVVDNDQAERIVERVTYNTPSEMDKKNIKDILFPIRICLHQKEINEKYLSCLKKTYGNLSSESCRDVKFLDEQID